MSAASEVVALAAKSIALADRYEEATGALLDLAGLVTAELKEAVGLIEWIGEEFGCAVQSDCENGVCWLNERAATDYLKDAPATLAAIHEMQDRIDAFLSRHERTNDEQG